MALESIALIPSGYKATKVYSQLPVNGNGDFTFDRGTSADQTRVNKNGLIESVAQDVPRLDYLDGGCPSLLLEPASTNLITYSEDFVTGWSVSGGLTITPSAILSPDGSVNASEITLTATDGKIQNSSFGSLTGDYTFSFFAKAGVSDVVYTFFSGGIYNTWIDLNTGTLLNSTGTGTTEIVDYGNGWWKISMTATLSATTEITIEVADDGASTGTIGDSIYVYGAQLEQQSYATSYIPTSGATATRAAETCNSAGTTAEINSQEGVLFVEYKPSVDSANKQVTLSDGTTTERIIIEVRDSGATFRFYSQNSTSSNQSDDFSVLDNDVYYKIAYQYSSTSLKIYVNGLLFDEITGTIYLPSGLNELALDTGTGSLPLLGRTKKLKVYNDTTTDLEQLTGFTSFAEMSSYLSYS